MRNPPNDILTYSGLIIFIFLGLFVEVNNLTLLLATQTSYQSTQQWIGCLIRLSHGLCMSIFQLHNLVFCLSTRMIPIIGASENILELKLIHPHGILKMGVSGVHGSQPRKQSDWWYQPLCSSSIILCSGQMCNKPLSGECCYWPEHGMLPRIWFQWYIDQHSRRWGLWEHYTLVSLHLPCPVFLHSPARHEAMPTIVCLPHQVYYWCNSISWISTEFILMVILACVCNLVMNWVSIIQITGQTLVSCVVGP